MLLLFFNQRCVLLVQGGHIISHKPITYAEIWRSTQSNFLGIFFSPFCTHGQLWIFFGVWAILHNLPLPCTAHPKILLCWSTKNCKWHVLVLSSSNIASLLILTPSKNSIFQPLKRWQKLETVGQLKRCHGWESSGLRGGREPQCSASAGQVAQVKVGSNNKQFTNSHL